MGKIVKIDNNDLYGNVDDRKVSLFACFIDKVYMNRYCIFCFNDEYDKNILYYGSIHLKPNSVVVFSVNSNEEKVIDKFINGYINNNLNSNDMELVNIDSVNKIELISYNKMDFNDIVLLDKLFIIKETKNEDDNLESPKKPKILYVILVLLILLAGGLTYLYLRPNDFLIEYNKLVCTKDAYNNDMHKNYKVHRNIYFDKKDTVKRIDNMDIYIFNDIESYNDFKQEKKEQEYFKIDGSFKYDDESLELKIMYDDKSNYLIDEYDELKDYLTSDGFTCSEEKYYE